MAHRRLPYTLTHPINIPSMAKEKASAALFDQLQTAIEGGEGEEIVGKVKVGIDISIKPTPNCYIIRLMALHPRFSLASHIPWSFKLISDHLTSLIVSVTLPPSPLARSGLNPGSWVPQQHSLHDNSSFLKLWSDLCCHPFQGTVVFNIDGEKWTLVLNPEERKVFKGEPEGKPNLTLTISDENFVKLVMGKMGPQQVPPSSAKEMPV